MPTQNDQPVLGFPALRGIYFYLSSYCNLRCAHCWISPKHLDATEAPEEAPLIILKDIIDQAMLLGLQFIKITGGEPFLSQNLKPLIAYAAANKLKIFIETNGTLIDEDEAKFLKEQSVGQVSVSLDGPDQKINERLRKAEWSFDKTIKGIKTLKHHGLNVQLIMSLCKYNCDHLKETISLAEENGVNSFKINYITSIGRGESLRSRGDVLTVAECIRLNKVIEEELQPKCKVKIRFDIPPVFKSLTHNKGSGGVCAIKNILGVLSDGSISICGIGEIDSSLRLGDVRDTPLKEIWEKVETLRTIREGVPSKLTGICGKCIYKGFCLGKCRAEAYYNHKDFLSPHDFCDEAFRLGLFPLNRMFKQTIIRGATS